MESNKLYEVCPPGHFFTQTGVMKEAGLCLGEKLSAVAEICAEYSIREGHNHHTGKTEQEMRQIMIDAGLATVHEFHCVDLYGKYLEMTIGDGECPTEDEAKNLIAEMYEAWGVNPQQELI